MPAFGSVMVQLSCLMLSTASQLQQQLSTPPNGHGHFAQSELEAILVALASTPLHGPCSIFTYS